MVGLVLPLAAIPVVDSGLPGMIKTPMAAVLFFGFELAAIPAVAIMGRANFDRIMGALGAKLGRATRWLKPAGEIGPRRHMVGVVLFFLPLAPTYIMAYAPANLPSDRWLAINTLADMIFLISLFVLGGDFWDKLRALFSRRARAVFPTEFQTP